MDVNRPDSVVLSASTHAVLAVLAGTSHPLTGRDVARLAEFSAAGIHRVLVHLVEHGIVHARTAGSASLYTLNREHLATGPLLTLVRMADELAERLTESLSRWEVAPSHVSMFGSSARADGSTTSDIDLLVVRPNQISMDAVNWREQLAQTSNAVWVWTGNEANWLEMSEAELAVATSTDEQIVENWLRDGKLIGGRPLRDLVNRDIHRLERPF